MTPQTDMRLRPWIKCWIVYEEICKEDNLDLKDKGSDNYKHLISNDEQG